jgi:hypothetical protein
MQQMQRSSREAFACGVWGEVIVKVGQVLVEGEGHALSTAGTAHRTHLVSYCGVVWCGVVWCGVVWCGVVWCGVVWCGVVWCGVVLLALWHWLVWLSLLHLCRAVLCRVVLCCAVVEYCHWVACGCTAPAVACAGPAAKPPCWASM